MAAVPGPNPSPLQALKLQLRILEMGLNNRAVLELKPKMSGLNFFHKRWNLETFPEFKI